MLKAKLVTAALVGTLVFGGVFAFAATLGSISTATIGASSSTVAACDTDGVSATYTSAWDAADKRYEISEVTVAAVSDACDGQTLKVSITDAGGAQLEEGVLSIPAGAATSFVVPLAQSVSADLAAGIHVIIA